VGTIPVDPNGSTVVAGLPLGAHTYTIQCVGPGGISPVAWTIVQVNSPPDYRICPASALVPNGGTTQLRAYYQASGTVDCSNLTGATEVTNLVTWSSSNPAIATVDSGANRGLVRGQSPGTATVTVGQYAGLSASVDVTVTVLCVPSNSCASPAPAAQAANQCPTESFVIDDGCGSPITCFGTRTCDFNWKEVAP
jgi:hypothetical protein